MASVMPQVGRSDRLKIRAEVAEMIARRPEGQPLESPFYASQEIFDIDMKVIFGQRWLYVGSEVEIPEPGDYLTVEILDDSIIVVRNDDDEIRAFYNSCCHRGARILNDDNGTLGNIVCPYHQWTYNLDGKLMFAKHMGENFDTSGYALAKVHVRNVAGLLFICLAENPPDDIEEMVEALEPRLRPHQLKNAKVAWQYDIIEKGNWKLVMENNRECYHCAVNHPELINSFLEFNTGYVPSAHASQEDIEAYQAFQKLSAEKMDLWENVCQLPSGLVDKTANTTGFGTQRMPLDGKGESETMSSGVACTKLMGDFDRPDLGTLSVWTHPNSWHHFMSDHVVSFQFLPLGPDRTRLRTTWLVHKDAVEGEDYDLERLTEVWKATNDEDSRLVEISQKGVQSKGYRPGKYSPTVEGLVEKFTSWYVDQLAASTEKA